LDDAVSGLQDKGYVPTSGEIGEDLVISLVTGETPEHPATQAIVDGLVAKSGNSGEDFRKRARDAVNGAAAARCAARAEQIRQVIFKLEMDAAGEEASDESDIPSCEAIDLGGLVEQVAGQPAEEGAVVVQADNTLRIFHLYM